MTDRELLERAAKAAGAVYWDYCDICQLGGVPGEFAFEVDFGNQDKDPDYEPGDGLRVHWNPLTSDADAFRLADKLGLIVDTWNERVILASRYGLGHRDWTHVSDDELYDGLEATRRAITRAAAAIGEQK